MDKFRVFFMTTTQNLLTNRIKPAVKWPGGKSRHLHRLLPLIPPHGCYVEVFAGGLALLLAKPRSQLEVVNDLNGELVNFYRVVKFHLDALPQELDWYLNARQTFHETRQHPGLTDVQRAARYFIRLHLSYGSMGHSFGVRGARASLRNKLQTIEAVHERLDKVIIENLDWKRCVDLYDRPDTFFFFDPPYTVCSIDLYDAWGAKEMTELAARLKTLRGTWLLTVDDSKICRKAFAEHRLRKISMRNGIPIVRGEHRVEFRELLITPRKVRRAQPNKPVIMKPNMKLFGNN